MTIIKILIISVLLLMTNLYASKNTYEITKGAEKNKIKVFNIFCSKEAENEPLIKYLVNQYSKNFSVFALVEKDKIKFITSKINNYDDILFDIKIDILKNGRIFDSSNILKDYKNYFITKKVLNGDYYLAFNIINSKNNNEYCKLVTNKPIKIIDRIIDKINTKISIIPKNESYKNIDIDFLNYLYKKTHNLNNLNNLMIAELLFSLILIISFALIVYKHKYFKAPVFIILAISLFILTVYLFDQKIKIFNKQVIINENTSKHNVMFEKTFKELKKLEKLSLFVKENSQLLEKTQRYVISELETINNNEYKLLQSINISIKKTESLKDELILLKTSTNISNGSFNNRIGYLSEEMGKREKIIDSIDNELNILKRNVKLFIEIKEKRNGRIISLKKDKSAIKIK